MIKNLSIDPTYECNKTCPTCRCSIIAKFYPPSQRLSDARLEQLIDDFKHLGGKNVYVFGGEPLLVSSTYFILKRAKKLNLNTCNTSAVWSVF